MLKVITTVGTSIFDNYNDYCKENDRELLNKNYLDELYENRDNDFDVDITNKINLWINEINDKGKISAELKSILKLKKERNEDLEVYLIATDTVASSLAAEILKDILKSEGIKVYFDSRYDVIKNLQVKDFEKFEKGKDNLIKRISHLIDEFIKDKKGDKKRKFIRKNVIFNITGGYKGVIPLLTILAQLYECQLFYIFENSENAITIPRIPLNFDAFLLESLLVDIYLKKKDKSHKFRNKDKLKDFGFINKNEKLTALGELFYKMAYSYNPLSPNVLGYFIEYKILEYLHNKNINFEHSFKYNIENNKTEPPIELDFVFKKNNNDWEVWEIKSLGMFLNSELREKIINQFKRQLLIIKEMKTYKVIIYSITDNIKNELKTIVESIANDFKKEFSGIKISFDFLYIKGMKGSEQEEGENPYQALFRHSIKENHFYSLISLN